MARRVSSSVFACAGAFSQMAQKVHRRIDDGALAVHMRHQRIAITVYGQIGETIGGAIDEAVGGGVGRAMQRRAALPGCVDQAWQGH